jgi:hypothetical protein
MKIKAGVNFHNRFDIVKNGEWVGYAENIILDQMYSRLCTLDTYFVNIHFGTGTGTPTPERTTLFTHLGRKTAVDEELIKAFPTSKWVRKIVLNPEEYVGERITEVGVAFGSSASNLVTHAMIKDAEGNPLSIDKTELDVIEIYATIFVTFADDADIKWFKPASDNRLVNYLIGATLSPYAYTVGIHGDTVHQDAIATKTPSRSRDGQNLIFNTVRFGITEGNYIERHIGAFSLAETLGFEMPALGVLGNKTIENIVVGTGDGEKTTFDVPYGMVKNMVVKLDGVPTSDFVYEPAPKPPMNDSDQTYAHTCYRLEKEGYYNILSAGYPFYQSTVYTYDDGETYEMIVERLKDMTDFMVGIQRLAGASNSGGSRAEITVYGSNDLETWSTVIPKFVSGNSRDGSPITWQTFGETVNDYQYLRFVSYSYYNAGMSTYSFKHRSYVAVPQSYNKLVLNQPPAEDVVVTVSGDVEYLPKTEDYVIDLTFALQFGEGVKHDS